MSSNNDTSKTPVATVEPSNPTQAPPSSPPQQPLTPEQLLLNIIISNNQILQKMARVMEQQIIYTNALLFPNNDRSNTAATTTATPTAGNQ